MYTDLLELIKLQENIYKFEFTLSFSNLTKGLDLHHNQSLKSNLNNFHGKANNTLQKCQHWTELIMQQHGKDMQYRIKVMGRFAYQKLYKFPIFIL